MCLSTIIVTLEDVIGGENVLIDKEKEIEELAKKAVKMQESSLRTLIFATDILLARDQIEKKELETVKREP
ncbi:hypothetical protein C819_02265 [Lachnospiraceae bacterium 10-1]|nr:hypothetical protein C819_02265 [Lachnospiraceae bacterium 10-1]